MDTLKSNPPKKSKIRTSVLFAAIFSICCCSSGCLLDPQRESPFDDILEAKPFDSPANTLYNFSLAHTLEDAVLYGLCLAESYDFIWDDPDSTNYIHWNKNDDLEAMEKMFASPDIIETRFEYAVDESVFVDSTETDYYLNIDFSVIEIAGGSYAHGRAIFSFDISKPDSVSILRIYDRTNI